MNKRLVAIALIGLVMQTPALAGDNQWEFALTPYLWFAGLKGNVATIPPLPAAPIDVSSQDALEDTKIAYMLLFTAKKNRHGVFFDYVYSDVESEEEVIPQLNDLLMTTRTKTSMPTLAYQYEVYRYNNAMLDLLAGVRYWSIDSNLKFSRGFGVLAGREISHKESWYDPVVGFSGQAPFGNTKFYMSGGLGFGGFGVGSDSFFDLNLNFGYQWNKSIGTALGYRLYDVEYNKDDFLYDVRQEGWLFGLTWAF